MSIYNTTDGGSILALARFLDSDGQPLEVHNTMPGPIVTLLLDDDVLVEGVAVPDQEIGVWKADVGVPDMDILETAQLALEWNLRTASNDVYKVTDVVFVEPEGQRRIGDVVVLRGQTQKMQITVPQRMALDLATQPDTVAFTMYDRNTPVYTATNAEPTVDSTSLINKTVFDLPALPIASALEARLLTASYNNPRTNNTQLFTYKVWHVSPQMLIASSLVEDYINKARLENVIPALEYTQGDLMSYLYRGLQLFNSLPPVITGFTGINMQGSILDNWITCACYYALGAQLQAEGALAFDFSGQVVNLNIDRTPSIEAALGRIEARIEDIVKPFKKLLGKVGLKGGDGSQGNNLSFSPNIGTLGLINAPTTNIGFGSTHKHRTLIR